MNSGTGGLNPQPPSIRTLLGRVVIGRKRGDRDLRLRLVVPTVPVLQYHAPAGATVASRLSDCPVSN